MYAKHILAAFGVMFAIAVVVRLSRDGALTPQTRAWLLIAAIFAGVSTWLWLRQ